MGLLNGSIFYMSGPIDNADDHGIGWRQHVIATTKNLGIKWLDPTNKPGKMKANIAQEKQHLINLKEAGNFKEVKVVVKSFRRHELRFVDISDGIIAYIDPDIHSSGTYDEIYTAERQCKPRFLFVKGGLRRCPNWLFDVFKLDDMFETVDDCVQRLVDIDSGLYPMSREWVLIRDCL